MNKLLIATNNSGKIKELHELLDNMGIQLVTPVQINLDLDVIEDGLTYAENASKKALAFAQASGLISLADDSGLEVDALNGEPGIYSARYGSENGQKLSDAGRRQYLLQKLEDIPRPWTARFHATVAIAVPNNVISPQEHRGGVSEAKNLEEVQTQTLQSLCSLRVTNDNVYLAEGWCEGEIIPEERGTGGFGYDPIFLLPESGKTMAELSMDEKNRLSHRARAVMNARECLETLFWK
jgi:XTP/dITP diphosphohydrolase